MLKYKAVSRTITGDELLARCSVHAKLLYHRLYLDSDGAMRFYGSPAMIKGRCHPLDKEFDESTIIDALGELRRRRRIRFYPADGQVFLVVLGNRLPKPIVATFHPDPEAGFSKPGNEYIPAFLLPAGGSAEVPEILEDEDAPPPPAPPTSDDNESCLLSFHDSFGLTETQAQRVLGAYCGARRNNNWCDLDRAESCQEAVTVIVERGRSQNKKLKRNGGKGIRDWPMYLSKSLQESLLEDADDMKQKDTR